MVLVGLESGLPCHRKDYWLQESTTGPHHLVGIVPLDKSHDFFFSFP